MLLVIAMVIAQNSTSFPWKLYEDAGVIADPDFFDQLYRYGVFVACGLSALTYVALTRVQAPSPVVAAEG